MAEDPGTDQLRNQIDEQRAAISDTVEQIENRVVPGRVMARGQDRVKGRMSAMKPSGWLDNLSNPLAAGALALGAGWVVGSIIPRSETEQRMADSVTEKIEPRLEEAAGHAQEKVQAAMDA